MSGFHVRVGWLGFMICGLLAATFNFSSAGAQVAREAPAVRAGSFHLSGTVVNSVTGESVPRALVELTSPMARVALTDLAGHFDFGDLPAGPATLVCSKPGFIPPVEPPPRIEVKPDAAPVTLKLTPQTVISGTVEMDEEPVEGVPIRLLSARVVNGRRELEQAGDATTDEDGAFRISGLPAGSYFLMAGPSDDTTMTPPDSLQLNGYSETFYPESLELSGATPIEVAAGQQAQVFVPLREGGPFEISGMISGVLAGDGVELRLLDSTGEPAQAAIRYGPRGWFVARVRAGAYTLQAYATDSGGGSVRASEKEITVSSDVGGVTLLLAPLTTLTVSVRQERLGENHPIRRVGGAAGNAANGPAANVRLISTEWRLNPSEYSSAPDAGSSTDLSVTDLGPGTYRVEIMTQSPWYVASATSGGVDLLREDLTIAPGVTPPPVEIVLRDDKAAVTGTLLANGYPTRGTAILVSERFPRAIAKADAGPDGKFAFSNLAPGDYRLFSFDGVDYVEYSNPSVLEAYSSNASRLSLQPNQQTAVISTVIREGR